MPGRGVAVGGAGRSRDNDAMSKSPSDDEDLTRVLDGWKPAPGRGDPAADPTRILDGWKVDPNAGTRASTSATAAPEITPRARLSRPDPAKARLPDDLDLRVPTRFSKFDSDDVTDVDAVWTPSAEVMQAGQKPGEPPPDADWQPSEHGALARALPPRVLASWKPGAWIGAVRQVFDSVARVVSTAQGPVVDTYPPHVLLALWPPQSPAAPFLDRWPQRVLLSAVSREAAAEELLRHLPADAELWLGEHDIDWATIGEAVLLHEPGLRDFQLKELRAFVDAERQAAWDHANKAYRLPASGQPIERVT